MAEAGLKGQAKENVDAALESYQKGGKNFDEAINAVQSDLQKEDNGKRLWMLEVQYLNDIKEARENVNNAVEEKKKQGAPPIEAIDAVQKDIDRESDQNKQTDKWKKENEYLKELREKAVKEQAAKTATPATAKPPTIPQPTPLAAAPKPGELKAVRENDSEGRELKDRYAFQVIFPRADGTKTAVTLVGTLDGNKLIVNEIDNGKGGLTAITGADGKTPRTITLDVDTKTDSAGKPTLTVKAEGLKKLQEDADLKKQVASPAQVTGQGLNFGDIFNKAGGGLMGLLAVLLTAANNIGKGIGGFFGGGSKPPSPQQQLQTESNAFIHAMEQGNGKAAAAALKNINKLPLPDTVKNRNDQAAQALEAKDMTPEKVKALYAQYEADLKNSTTKDKALENLANGLAGVGPDRAEQRIGQDAPTDQQPMQQRQRGGDGAYQQQYQQQPDYYPSQGTRLPRRLTPEQREAIQAGEERSAREMLARDQYKTTLRNLEGFAKDYGYSDSEARQFINGELSKIRDEVGYRKNPHSGHNGSNDIMEINDPGKMLEIAQEREVRATAMRAIREEFDKSRGDIGSDQYKEDWRKFKVAHNLNRNSSTAHLQAVAEGRETVVQKESSSRQTETTSKHPLNDQRGTPAKTAVPQNIITFKGTMDDGTNVTLTMDQNSSDPNRRYHAQDSKGNAIAKGHVVARIDTGSEKKKLEFEVTNGVAVLSKQTPVVNAQPAPRGIA